MAASPWHTVLGCNFCVPDLFPVHPCHGFQLALQSGWIRCFKCGTIKPQFLETCSYSSSPSRQPNSIIKSRETFYKVSFRQTNRQHVFWPGIILVFRKPSQAVDIARPPGNSWHNRWRTVRSCWDLNIKRRLPVEKNNAVWCYFLGFA